MSSPKIRLLLATTNLKKLKELLADYPYLFSFAVRTNPFDAKARPEVIG